VLGRWQEMWPRFVKVFPKDYRRMLEQIKKAELDGFNGEEAVMNAFEANAHDLARVSGN